MSGSFQMAQAPQYANPASPAPITSTSAPAGSPTTAQPRASTVSISAAATPGHPISSRPANPFDQFDAPASAPAATVVAQGSPAAQNPFDQFDPVQQQPGYQQAYAAQAARNAQPGSGPASAVENGFTANFAPQIGGAINAAQQYLSNAATGSQGKPSPGQAYAATRDADTQLAQQYEAEHPYAAFAANLMGGAATGIGSATKKLVEAAPALLADGAGGVKQALAKGVALVGTGAATGAAYGAGGDPTNRGQGAAIGGAEGAVLAPAITIGAKAGQLGYGIARNVVNNLSGAKTQAAGASQRAQQWLTTYLDKNSLTPGTIAAGSPLPVSEGGQTVAESLGNNGVKRAAALAGSPGVAGDIANNILQERAAGQTDRLMSGFHQATGIEPTQAQAAAAQLVAQGREDVNPAYAAIRSNPTPIIRTPQISALANSDPSVQRAMAQVTASTRLSPPVAPLQPGFRQALTGKLPQGVPAQVPQNADFWLRVRQQLADNVERDPLSGQPLANDGNAQLNRAASDLGGALKDAVPGFADAQTAAATYKAPAAAFQTARGMLFGSGAKNNLSSVQALLNSAQTPGEQQAIQQAFAADIADKAYNGTAKLKPGNFTAPGVQKKLQAVFGSDVASNIGRIGKYEQNIATTGNQILPNANSKTASLLNFDPENGDMLNAAMEGGKAVMDQAKEGKTIGAATAALAHFGQYMKSKAVANSDQFTKDAIAKYLLSDASSFGTFKPTAVPRASARPLSSQLLIPPVIQATTNASTQGQTQ